MGSSFRCQCCGHCCEGRGGIVVSPFDLGKISQYLNVTPEVFVKTWGEERGNKLHIRMGDDGSCVFFQKGTGCKVHAAKPAICRAWPYFRGNLVDAESLAFAKDFCPGITASVTHDEFVKEGLVYLAQENLIGQAGEGEASALQVDDIRQQLAEKA